MTPDSALARELADRLADSTDASGASYWITDQDAHAIIALLRKWPEPDKDAARYRWLRASPDADVQIDDYNEDGNSGAQYSYRGDALDSAIDAAMTASPQEER